MTRLGLLRVSSRKDVKDVKKVNSVNTWNGILSPNGIGEKNGR